MLGADFYETETEAAALLAEGGVPVGIGENTKIRYEPVTRTQPLVSLDKLLTYSHISAESVSLTKMLESERM